LFTGYGGLLLRSEKCLFRSYQGGFATHVQEPSKREGKTTRERAPPFAVD